MVLIAIGAVHIHDRFDTTLEVGGESLLAVQVGIYYDVGKLLKLNGPLVVIDPLLKCLVVYQLILAVGWCDLYCTLCTQK